MRNQIKLLQTAFMFYTRIPVGQIKNYQSDFANRCVVYLPFIGTVVGALSALVFYLSSQIVPVHVSILLSMTFSIYITGAFHEDGLADFCDGFGGGYTKEKIMTIMKDSCIGTYGMLGLMFALFLKFSMLRSLGVFDICIGLVAAHTLSRCTPLIMVYTSKYVQRVELSKGNITNIELNRSSILVAIFYGLTSLFFISWDQSLIFCALIFIVFWIFRRYVQKKIGGYTGDVLGALQQISELVFYFSMIIQY